MLLIPEQVIELRRNLRSLRQNLGTYKNYYENYKTGDHYFGKSIDYMIEDAHQVNLNQIKEIESLLNYPIIEKRSFQQIDIGTKFSYIFLDDPDFEEQALLTSSLDGLTSNAGFISLNSPMGKSIIHAQENDVISYHGPTDEIYIKITKLEKDSRKYLNFIRKSHNKELNLDDIRDITITPSQVDLLLLELKRIQYNLTTHPKKELYERADIVNELLRTIPLAKPVTNNSVGIGTVFDLTVTVNGEERIYPSIELINCAITDEFEGEYLEKSSELGTCLFGLTENESFTYMSCEGQVVGKVSNIINNQKVNENSNINHKIYHK